MSEKNPCREVATENRYEPTRAVTDQIRTEKWVTDPADPDGKQLFGSERSHLSDLTWHIIPDGESPQSEAPITSGCRGDGWWSCVETLAIYQRPDAEIRQLVLTDRRPIREIS